MDASHHANAEQATLWNGSAGRSWVETQAVLDTLFMPFQHLLVEAAVDTGASRVLDVGCGTGSTTRAIAGRLGATAECLGVDISEPMIAAARERAERDVSPARFVAADAQVHAFEPGRFDLIVSRFGVMFFDDAVRAFANLRQATRGDGALRFIAWRSAAENPFMTTAERAAAPLLPPLPARRPGAPGQFAMADQGHVANILRDSGWTAIDIRPIDVSCMMSEADLVRYLSWMGPVGMALQQADEATRHRVVNTVRAAFEPYVQGREVRFTAACWWVSAVA
jgi:SAM-dependent methyltransferase